MHNKDRFSLQKLSLLLARKNSSLEFGGKEPDRVFLITKMDCEKVIKLSPIESHILTHYA